MRRRILVAIVALTTLAVIVFAVPLGFVLANLYREEEIVRLERAAGEAGEHVPTAFPRSTDRAELRRERGQPPVGLYGRNGRLVSGSGPHRSDPAVRSALHGETRDDEYSGRLIVAVPLIRGERIDGALRASVPLSAVSDRTRNAIMVMIAIGMGAVGLSALIGIYQSRRLARPIKELARTATQLGDGDFTARGEASGMPEVDAVSHALDSTATRLDQMLSRERSFSEDASHQLRTPLTGLRVNLEAARLDPAADHNVAFEAALGEVDRLERTIDDLLALAREHPADRTELNVHAVLGEIESEWHGRFAAVDRPLRVTIAAHLPRVTVSARAVRQIIDVLLDNAFRYGADVVSMRARSAPVGIVIEIADDGPGITGNSERIFERRGEGSTGHGIGLALARSLAEAEGARLRLEHGGPNPVFALFLPGAPSPDDE